MTPGKEELYKQLLHIRDATLEIAYRKIGELSAENTRNAIRKAEEVLTAQHQTHTLTNHYTSAIQGALDELKTLKAIQFDPPIEAAIGILTNALKDTE